LDAKNCASTSRHIYPLLFLFPVVGYFVVGLLIVWMQKSETRSRKQTFTKATESDSCDMLHFQAAVTLTSKPDCLHHSAVGSEPPFIEVRIEKQPASDT